MQLGRTWLLSLVFFGVGLGACSYDSIEVTPGEDAAVSDGQRDADASDVVDGADAATLDADSSDFDASSELDASDAEISDAAMSDGLLHVEPLSAAAPFWNDFVSAADPEVACDADAQPRAVGNCVHLGSMRKVVYPARASCDNLKAADDEEWFTWTCKVSHGHATFVTVDMKPDIDLESFIDTSGTDLAWRTNFVKISDGDTLIDSTVPERFWNNPLRKIAIATNSETKALTAKSGVYVVMGSPMPFLSIEADNITLLVPKALRVTNFEENPKPLVGTTKQIRFLRIENAAFKFHHTLNGLDLDLVYGVLRDLDLQRDGWTGDGADLLVHGDGTLIENVSSIFPVTGMHLEGKHLQVDNIHVGPSGLEAIQIKNCSDSVLSNLVIGESYSGALRIQDSSHLELSHLRVSRVYHGEPPNNGRVSGMNVLGVKESTFSDVLVTNCQDDGIDVAASPTTSALSENNLFFDVRSASNGDTGFVLGGRNNRALMITATSNDGDGIRVEGQNNLLLHATTLQNNGAGTSLSSSNDTLINALSSNNSTGIFVGPSLTNTYIEDVFATNNDAGQDVSVESTCIVRGQLSVSSSNSCKTGVGITEPFAMTPACTTGGQSDAVVVMPSSIQGQLVGALAERDPANNETVDGQGSLAYREDFDWASFSNSSRHWGVFGAADTAQSRGRCNVGDICAVWDTRANADTDVVDVLGAPLFPAVQAESHVHTHVWFAVTEAKCGEIPDASWSGSTCSTLFVSHSFEPIDDGIGNDDGLCEFDETCVLASNRGAFPGQGTLEWLQSSETDGRVKLDGSGGKIKLYRYASSSH